MKKKIFLSLFIVLLIAVFFTACNKGSADNQYNDYPKENVGDSGSSNEIVKLNLSRKIIYYYNCYIYTENIDESIKNMQDSLSKYDDAYIEQSNSSFSTYNKSATFKIRIKTEDFNSFVADVKLSGNVTNENLTSEDVTQNYVDLEAQKLAKEKEIERLFDLYDKATTIYDINTVSVQISKVQGELNAIISTLNKYDSLVSLSTIELYFSESVEPSNDTNFGAKLLNVLKNTGKAVVTFFEYLLYAIIYVTPFAVFGLIVYLSVSFVKKKIASRKIKK